MQHKLPIVTTDEGGIPDITDGGCGLIGNSQDVESIANRIAELLTDKSKRVEMGNIAYQKYCEQYTIHAFEKNLLDILRSNLR